MSTTATALIFHSKITTHSNNGIDEFELRCREVWHHTRNNIGGSQTFDHRNRILERERAMELNHSAMAERVNKEQILRNLAERAGESMEGWERAFE